MYYEIVEGMEDAIAREKILKNWHRDWKINLIKKFNPEMEDLSLDWYQSIDGKLIIKDRLFEGEILKQVQDDFKLPY